MAASRFPTTQYTSSEFVESAGAVLFHLSTQRICLLHLKKRDEWLLAKGRRSSTESRAAAAIREACEETGYSCRLLPVTMETRAPPAVEDVNTPDQPRTYQGGGEPFYLTSRLIGERNLKLIWWFIAAVNENGEERACEDRYDRVLVGYQEALGMLTFRADRDIVEKAIRIVEAISD